MPRCLEEQDDCLIEIEDAIEDIFTTTLGTLYIAQEQDERLRLHKPLRG